MWSSWSSREGLSSRVRQLGAGSGSPGPVALQGLYSPRNILNKIFLYDNTISCSLKLLLEMYSLGLTFTLSCPTYWVLPSQLERETQFSKCRLRGITLGSCFRWSLHGLPPLLHMGLREVYLPGLKVDIYQKQQIVILEWQRGLSTLTLSWYSMLRPNIQYSFLLFF